MISWHDLYTVLCAVVPLYVAMMLAYGSVRWWGVLTPEQCGGINRFVAVFAVPLLSFHVISSSDPYAMDLRFVVADTLQKVMVLAGLFLWSICLPSSSSSGSSPLDWSITFFSLSSLPNTLIMGIPLLVAMYGAHSGDLMVQLVVLQCIVWYTLLLLLFELRAARALIAQTQTQHQGGGAAGVVISAVHVDADVVSLDGSQAEARAQIYSVSSSRNGDAAATAMTTPPMMMHRQSASLRMSSFGAADLFSLHSHSPRPSNAADDHHCAARGGGRRSAAAVVPSGDHDDDDDHPHAAVNDDLGLSTEDASSELSGLPVFRSGGDLHRAANKDARGRLLVPSEAHSGGSSRAMRPAERVTSFKAETAQDALAKVESGSTTMEQQQQQHKEKKDGRGQQTAPAGVMARLILTMVWRRLIRNPNTYASLVGLVWSLVAFRFHISMPVILRNSITILSDAGLGMAMFSLGLFMAMQPKIIACGASAASVSMAIRFLGGPAAMAAASAAVGLRGTLLRIAIVQAALPQGIVPFVFAKEYNLHATIICTGVIFGMLVALPITLLYYIILGLL
ncbi:hypothetical protein QOZ80_5BG0410350 [Eleusine coracana subsp. coracana]|nr:hypothetical protein QOZ80_5BG0410350 [Eleusine coracana subsp. coracana]